MRLRAQLRLGHDWNWLRRTRGRMRGREGADEKEVGLKREKRRSKGVGGCRDL